MANANSKYPKFSMRKSHKTKIESEKGEISGNLPLLGIVIVSILVSSIIVAAIIVSDKSNASDESFTTIDGDKIDLKDHKGKVILLYFFQLSCKYCKETDPQLADIDDDYSSDQLLIITITIDPADDYDDLDDWRNKHNPKWDIVQDDTSQSISERYDVSNTPTAVILDKEGNVSEKIVGSDEFESKSRAKIDELLLI